MRTRHVFSTPDLTTAEGVLAAARAAGLDNGNLSLIARADIELDSIDDEFKIAGTKRELAPMGRSYKDCAGASWRMRSTKPML